MTSKADWRHRVWTTLQDHGASADPFDRIPDFDGAEQAANRLATLSIWDAARVVMVVPDAAQAPVRQLALEADKLLYMAVPKLAGAKPFCRLTAGDMDAAGYSPADVAAHKQVLALGTLASPEEMEPVDLIVLGSVVVNRHGVRIGKGAGYADREIALLQYGNLLQQHTQIATTVHELQVIDQVLPEEPHDHRVDLVITSAAVYRARL